MGNKSSHVRPESMRVSTTPECEEVLRKNNYRLSQPDPDPGYCPHIFDGYLCWPSIPANTNFTQGCPKMMGIDEYRSVPKLCGSDGNWSNATAENPTGYTNYMLCFVLSPETQAKATKIAGVVRVIEYFGLAASFVTMIAAIAIFLSFRRLRVFRNTMHLHLMVSILIVTTIRLVIYIDMGSLLLTLIQKIGPTVNASLNMKIDDNMAATTATRPNNPTLKQTRYACESAYILLEYAKTVAYAWMVLEGWYLHHMLVVNAFSQTPPIWKFCLIGWGWPVIHVAIWMTAVVYVKLKANDTIPLCLGQYYHDDEMWFLDGVRLLELVVNTFFLLNIVRVLYAKACASNHGQSDMEQTKKSVHGAFMLIPLLGVPNIMQTIPLKVTDANFYYWTIYIFVAESTYMFQGVFISLLYCFTNKEVLRTLKNEYNRFRMRHASFDQLRRGSRAASCNLSLGTVNARMDTSSQPKSKRGSSQRGSNNTIPEQGAEYNAHTHLSPSVNRGYGTARDAKHNGESIPLVHQNVAGNSVGHAVSPFEVM